MRYFPGLLAVLFVLLSAPAANASGPRWVAGVNYFNPAAKGSPLVWAGGQVSYFLDQGALSGTVSNSQANSLVQAAAAVWSGVSTAAVSITQGGSLSEDVNGGNVTANTPAGTGAVLPTDALLSATNKPVAVVLDADGSVIDAIYGPGASDPNQCTQTGVYVSVDNFSTVGTIAHALILINGRCATSSALNSLLQYEMVRAWGQVLGLDWSQVNEGMWPASPTSDGLAGLPLMHSTERLCQGSSTNCLPNPTTLRLDDIAGLNQLYPVTQANASQWSGKSITAASTVTVTGTVAFRNGQGMQGVNVVLTPLNATANGDTPDLRYTVAAVSGAYFSVNGGNAVMGSTDAQGNTLGRFGTDDATKEGYFVLSGVPLPAGASSARYQLSIEPVNPLYVGGQSVGPYGSVAQVALSGAVQTVVLGSLSAGATVTHNFKMGDSADGTVTDDGAEAAPNRANGNGEWLAKLVGYGHTGWFQFHARANRYFTVEATSLNEVGLGTEKKAAMVIGFWNGSDPLGSAPALSTTTPFNGAQVGLSVLSAETAADQQVRVAYDDQRADGRPDFTYRARVLYADSVFPARLTLNGGTISIQGQGFRLGVNVTVGGVQAAVTSVTPTEITAVAAAVSAPTGTVVVAVQDPQTLGLAEILDGLSYDAHGDDGVKIVSAPSGTVQQGVPMPMVVQVVAADGQTPASNVQVSFTVVSGQAQMGCGATVCTAVSNGNGFATLAVTAMTAAATQIRASLADGAQVIAEFDGGTPPQIAATNSLYVAIGAKLNWTPVAIVLNNGAPVQGAAVQWVGGSGAQVATATTSNSNAAGLASTTVTVGPLAAGGTTNVRACQGQSGSCAAFSINAVHTESANLLPVSGVGQSLAAGGTVLPMTLQVIDGVGHPIAGAVVNFYQQMTAWQPPCPVGGRCPAAQKLGSLTTTATSDVNGLVTLTPMDGAGQPVNITGLGSVGQYGSLQFAIVEHP